MAAPLRPPFRADHVGSLLRPPELRAARERAAKGAITRAALKAVEDKAILDAVRLQEAAGLQGVTDGEFRRAIWHVDFLTGFDGITSTKTNYSVTFKGENGETAGTGSMLAATGRVRRSKPVMVEHFAYLNSVTRRTAKFCMPSPTYLHMRGGRKIIDREAYPDLDAFWVDIATAYRAEIADLAAAGCTYLQLDDVSFSCLCDPEIRDQIARDGEDPSTLPATYARVVNALLAERPASLAVTMHTCRGNHASMWMASGGYDAVAARAHQQQGADARIQGRAEAAHRGGSQIRALGESLPQSAMRLCQQRGGQPPHRRRPAPQAGARGRVGPGDLGNGLRRRQHEGGRRRSGAMRSTPRFGNLRLSSDRMAAR